ncbi:MAG: alpha/beta hydrolase, partial [Pseudomonadota bacterium]
MMKKTDTGRRWPLSAAMSALALAMSGCAVLDLPAETSQTVAEIESAEGVAISYAASGEGETTLVFIHGWSCDRSYWRNQVDLFDDAYRVIAVDLAGHGASGSDRETWSMEAFGADVAAAARADDAQRVVLVGHSMGGPVMLETARLLGDRVVAMIGVD